MNIDFQKVLAHSPNPYVIVDPALTIVWANDAYLRVTGREWDDISGREMFDAFPSEGESYRQLKTSFARVLETGEADEIAHIRYDIPNGNGGFDVHIWSATHTPFLSEDGQVEYILQHTVRITDFESGDTGRDAAGVMRRAEVVEKRYQGASRELDRFRSLFEQAPGFVAVLNGNNHRFLMANAAYRHLVGQRELVGRTVEEALPEVVDQGFVRLLDHVLEKGEPYFGKKERVLLSTGDGDQLEARYLEFIYQPIRGKDGFEGVLVQGHDVTEEVAFEDHQRILINELNHRVKNTLAVVQGLAQQSFRTGLEDPALGVFTNRLAALASAHNLLTERSWESADLETIVSSSLEATAGTDSSRYSLSGPPVVLQPQAAVTLSMVIHELCTNALKYGALSNDNGIIEIEWSIRTQGENSVLVLDWTERGGPKVGEPERRGFGSRLIERGLSGPDGRAELDFKPEGLHCRIEGRV